MCTNHNQDPAFWRECPFRNLRNMEGAGCASEGPEQIVCEAGGGIILGAGGSEQADSVCRSCDIPPSLKKRHACLFLVPFRIFNRSDVQSYYGCRWSLDIPSRNVPKNNDWCRGCRHWFPRPAESLVLNAIDYSRKALALFLEDAGLLRASDMNEVLNKKF